MDPTTQDPTTTGASSTDPSIVPGANDSGVSQDRVDVAAKAYADASANFNYWQSKVDTYQSDTTVDTATKNNANTQADSARAALSKAATDYSSVLTSIAGERQKQALTAKDPAQVDLWKTEADKAQAQADLVNIQAQMAQAKDQATIDSLTARAQAALQNAATTASKAQSLEGLQSSQTALAQAKAAVIPAMTQSTIDLHTSTIQRNAEYVKYLGARSDLLAAQTQTQASVQNLDAAKASLISGPQAQSMLSTAELHQAQANKLDLTNGATLQDLQAKAGLSDARVLQIYANIGKSQVLPYNDKTEPNLTVFNPVSGSVTGQPNPSYVNTALQGITDTNQAIQSVQQDIAAGNMTPDEGTALIDSLRQSLQYKALGVTPDQFVQMQNQQAQVGQNILGKYQDMLQAGSSPALTAYMQAAQKSTHKLPAFTGYSVMGGIANQIYGPDLKTAQSLIQQITPISDRLSALKNMALLGQAKAALTGAPIAPTASNPNPQQPPPTSQPAGPQGQTNDQGPGAAFMAAATAQPGGQTPQFWATNGGMPQANQLQTWQNMGNTQ